jgi:hypothetical protein
MKDQASRNVVRLNVMLSQPVSRVVEESSKLNKLNWLNFALFVLNFSFAYGVGDRGGLGHGTTTELSVKYQVRNIMSELKGFWGHILSNLQSFCAFTYTLDSADSQGFRFWHLGLYLLVRSHLCRSTTISQFSCQRNGSKGSGILVCWDLCLPDLVDTGICV